MGGQRSAVSDLRARRAVTRWAWRMFRLHWRQQLLVLAMLTVGVASAIGATSVATSWVAATQQADFGDANQVVTFFSPDPGEVEADIAAVRRSADTIDVVARRYLPVPGTLETVELRAQDPDGPYSAPLLAVREGRYPAASSELAVTDGVARRLDVSIGSTLTLDDGQRTVVGVVENPRDLGDEFALVVEVDRPDVLTVLLEAPAGQMVPIDAPHEGSMSQETLEGPSAEMGAAMLVLAVTTLAMVLISLVAVTGFVVMAQSRLRQLGILAAIGAAQKHVRLVVIGEGVVVGATGAVIGVATGLGLSTLAAPRLAGAVGARIEPDLPPWWLVAATMALAVAAAAAAAWWPARMVARVPVTTALRGRAPEPRASAWSAAPAGVCLATGLTYLTLAGDPTAHWIHRLLLMAGTLALVTGVLLLCPVAIGAVSASAAPLPVGMRLALRDLARNRTRSGAALAAVALVLGIATAIAAATSHSERTSAIGNLDDSQMLVTVQGRRIREVVTIVEPAEVAGQQESLGLIAGGMEDPVVLPLLMAVDPDREATPGRVRASAFKPVVLVGNGPRTADPGPLYVATPELLRYHGIDPATLDPEVDVLTVRTGEIGLRYLIDEEVVEHVERIEALPYGSAPTSLITLDALHRRGWEPALAAWLIDAGEPISGKQEAAARSAADQAGMVVETRDGTDLALLRSLRSGVTALGALLALTVLAMTVGLVRGETAGELRILGAAGASGTIRRTLSATTAGALALLGAVLGGLGAYLGVASGYVDDLGTLLPLPTLHLAAIGIGIPALASAGAWMLSGREPAGMARPIE